MTSLKSENEVRSIGCNTIQELPVAAAHDIKVKSIKDSNITRMKTTLKNKRNKNTSSNNFSLCDDVLMCAQRVDVPSKLQK